MKLVVKIKSLPELLALVALGIFLTVSILNVTFYARYIPGTVYKLAIAFSIFLLFVKEMFKRKYDYRALIGLFATILIYFIVGEMTALGSEVPVSILFIYALRDVPFKKVAQTSLVVSTCLLFFIIVSAKVGIITNYIEVSESRVRSYLGFRYALFPSMLLMDIVAIVFYLKQNKIQYWKWLLLSLSVYWVYDQTDSRLTFFSSCILLACSLLMKWFPELLSKLGYVFKAFKLTFIVNAIISFWVSFTYLNSGYSFINDLLFKVNHMLGGRLYLANKSLNLYGFGLLGRPVEWYGNGLTVEGVRNYQTYYLYVDNLYVQVLQRFGLLILGLMLSVLTLTLSKIIKKRQWVLALILILMSFHSMIDDLNFYLHNNIFWILVGALIYPDYQFSDESNEELGGHSFEKIV
ncbi:polymerase [Streptococcus sp. oral taxon 061]|uniref:polymerase n=1 Tax=Streptococcus sp. oral taxon 061 TaxID=712623 RepID=UPI0015BB92FA|nr:polymerase [Streptococcus sp. oral taxon 061]QLF55054.1 polymerase [Streptococcus sp. oral taxon 061]